MDFLERNLALMVQRQPELAGVLNLVHPARIRLLPSRKGPPTAFCDRGGAAPLPLHSRYDPLQEARIAVKDVALEDSDYFTVLGCGLGYILDALLERVPATEAHIFVVEADLEVLHAALSARDLSSILSLPHIHFAWPATGNDLADQWKEFFDPVHARQSVFLNHPPSLALNPELYKKAAEILRGKTAQIFTDLNTLVGKAPVFIDNFASNFRAVCAAPGVSSFADRFEGVPAVLVSAGPSLDRNIHELRRCRDRILVLAADTALKPLLAAGIEPHFVMSGDPGLINYQHLKGAETRHCYLVTEPTACPETLAMFPGRTVVCRFENSSLQALSAMLASKGTLRAWGSVATMCLDFALRIGCNPILFAGQDLAYSEGRTYCAGLHWDEDWFEGVTGPDQWQLRWAELCARSKLLPATDVFNRPVETTEKLISYWNWIETEIERNASVSFINATEGGILRSRVQIMSLREALYRNAVSGRNLREEIAAIYQDAALNAGSIDCAPLARLEAESDQLRRMLGRGLELCSAPHEGTAGDGVSIRQIKQSIDRLQTLAPLLDRFNQMGNLHFLRRMKNVAESADAVEFDFEAYRDLFESMSHAAGLLAAKFAEIRESFPHRG